MYLANGYSVTLPVVGPGGCAASPLPTMIITRKQIEVIKDYSFDEGEYYGVFFNMFAYIYKVDSALSTIGELDLYDRNAGGSFVGVIPYNNEGNIMTFIESKKDSNLHIVGDQNVASASMHVAPADSTFDQLNLHDVMDIRMSKFDDFSLISSGFVKYPNNRRLSIGKVLSSDYGDRIWQEYVSFDQRINFNWAMDISFGNSNLRIFIAEIMNIIASAGGSPLLEKYWKHSVRKINRLKFRKNIPIDPNATDIEIKFPLVSGLDNYQDIGAVIRTDNSDLTRSWSVKCPLMPVPNPPDPLMLRPNAYDVIASNPAASFFNRISICTDSIESWNPMMWRKQFKGNAMFYGIVFKVQNGDSIELKKIRLIDIHIFHNRYTLLRCSSSFSF